MGVGVAFGAIMLEPTMGSAGACTAGHGYVDGERSGGMGVGVACGAIMLEPTMGSAGACTAGHGYVNADDYTIYIISKARKRVP